MKHRFSIIFIWFPSHQHALTQASRVGGLVQVVTCCHHNFVRSWLYTLDSKMAGGRRLCGQWLRSASSTSRMAWMSASSTSSMASRRGLHMGGLHLMCSRRYSSVCCRTVLSLLSHNLIITCCNVLSPYAIPTVFTLSWKLPITGPLRFFKLHKRVRQGRGRSRSWGLEQAQED